MSEEEIDPGLELILPDERDDVRDRWLWGAVLVILALWAFSPSFFGNYIWDDDRYPQNPVVQGSADGLYDVWFNPSAPAANGKPGHYVTPQYYPMTFTSYWLVNQGPWGISAMAQHGVNLLLHAGSALLLWEILRRLRVPGAWVAAAIFAIHPMQAESVAWLAERKNVLAGLFFFGSILTYLQFLRIDKEDHKPKNEDFQWYVFSLLLFIAGLLSKSIICSMPAVMMILLWWKRRLSAKNVGLLLPFVVFGLAMSAVTAWFEIHIVGAHGPEWDFTPVQRLLIASHVIWFYAAKLLVPINLTFIYPKWSLDGSQWIYFAGLVVVLALLFSFFFNKSRGVLAAVLIYLVTLVPAMGFANVYPMRYSFVADHFQYLSGVALIVLAVALAARALRSIGPSSRLAGLALAMVFIAVLSITAWTHAKVFVDSQSLWEDVIAKNPQAWIGYESLANILVDNAQQNMADQQDVQQSQELAKAQANKAIEYAQDALALRPTLGEAYEHWGRALLILNQPAEALAKFQQAQSIEPQQIAIRNNLAVTLTRLGRIAEAEEVYRQALTLPSSAIDRAMTRVNLGRLRLDDGATAMRQAVASKNPTEKKMLARNIGSAYVEAAAQFGQATKEAPGYGDAWFYLGVVMIRLNQNGPAFDALQQAVEIMEHNDESNPNLVAAHSDLAMLYGVAGQYPQAGQEYMKVISIDHDNTDAYDNMGLLAAKLGKFPEAKEFLQMALKIDPKDQKAKAYLMEVNRAATRPTTRSATQPATAP